MTVLAENSMPEGIVAFAVVLALAIGAVFLFRSMLKHLRKVPPSFDDRDVTMPPPDDRDVMLPPDDRSG
jgi:hypothetical protein